MSFYDELKADLKKTNLQRQAEKQTVIEKGKQLSFYQLSDILDKLNYQIECLKTFIKNPELPENQKAISKTKLFYLEEKRKQIQKRIKENYLEEIGL